MSPINILITCIHYPVASGRYIARAFERLGHSVRTTGPATGNKIWGVTIDDRFVWTPQDAAEGWTPDLIINADSAYAPAIDRPVVLWGVDNHVRDYRLRDWAAMFLAHSWGARMDEPGAHWLPCAFDPTLHFDQAVERDVDVACIGMPYEGRREIVSKLVSKNVNTYYGIGAVYEEYNAIYNRAKIALVKSACGDLAQRFFENMAQGCCVLSDYTPDAIKLGFEPYKDFWLYSGPEDAAYAAKWLLESGEWRTIAASGHAKVQEHTWDNRARELLHTLGVSQ